MNHFGRSTPHETVYHCHVAPLPKKPPISVRVTAFPKQTEDEGFALTEEGAVDILTVTVVLTHVVGL